MTNKIYPEGFLKAYWNYKKDGGEMSMRMFSECNKDADKYSKQQVKNMKLCPIHDWNKFKVLKISPLNTKCTKICDICKVKLKLYKTMNKR